MPQDIVFAILLILGALLFFSAATETFGQALEDGSKPAPPSIAILHIGTQRVVIDVIVRGRDGRPVRGLKREDFMVSEDNSTQTINRFEEHSWDLPVSLTPTLTKLPPGTFTDYTPVPPNGALNILLLDALNTPATDQSYMLSQLRQYVINAATNTRIAIFGLSDHLYLLQGFTSDPALLKAAVEHKLMPNPSNLLDDPAGNAADPTTLTDMLSDTPPTPPQQTSSIAQIGLNLQQFEAGEQSVRAQLRVQYTLDAFDQLGHYLANFPGHKNLIWFSGAFPLNIFPDATIDSGSAFQRNNGDQFHEAIDLLARAHVAVFPVDARGLSTNPVYSASRSGRGYGKNPPSFAADIAKFTQSQAVEHSTMEQLADETGGHAYYNTNGLADAIENALAFGANYYTLTYTPANHDWNGQFRKLHIALTGAPAATGATLSYRRGYYADDPNQPRHPANVAAANSSPSHPASAYAQAAMDLGAPSPQDILFKVRVLPASASTEETVAAGNQLDPTSKVKGPFRRFNIDLAVLPAEFHLTSEPDGRRTGKIDFITFVYDSQGEVINRVGQVIDLDMTPETYKKFMDGAVDFHMQVSAPTRGDNYFRIAVEDILKNRLGVVQIPVSDVGSLAPLTQPSTAPSSHSR